MLHFALSLLPAIILLMCVATFLVTRMGGWNRLGKTYPHKEKFPTEHHWNYRAIPNLGMRNCVQVALDDKGMYFVMQPLRFGTSPIFVPWEDIKISRDKFFGMRTVKAEFRKIPDVPLHFYTRDAETFGKADSRWQLA